MLVAVAMAAAAAVAAAVHSGRGGSDVGSDRDDMVRVVVALEMVVVIEGGWVFGAIVKMKIEIIHSNCHETMMIYIFIFLICSCRFWIRRVMVE